MNVVKNHNVMEDASQRSASVKRGGSSCLETRTNYLVVEL